MGMYDYKTPAGYGDYFYIYVYDPAANGLTSGNSYAYIPIEIQDGAFVLRAFAGLESCLSQAGAVSTWGTIQIYDAQTRLFFDVPTSVFTSFATGTAVLPEKEFPSNSALRFDLNNTALSQDQFSVVPTSQLAFYGVRRVPGAQSDPAPSPYPYKEIDFSIPFNFTLLGNGTSAGPGPQLQYTVPIQDYDFELRRMEYGMVVLPFVVTGPSSGGGTLGFVFTANELSFAGATVELIVGGPFNVTVVGTAVTATIPTFTSAVDFIAFFNASIANTIMKLSAIGAIGPVDQAAAVMTPSHIYTLTTSGAVAPNFLFPEFQITLYDANWRARSNAPVNCNRIMHYKNDSTVTGVSPPMNYYPSPGILYPVNGVIRFDIYSLVPSNSTLASLQVFITFKGVRRLPC